MRSCQKMLILYALALWAVAGEMARADLVVPNGLATVEGNTNSIGPFGATGLSLFTETWRYQQVYAASQFGALEGPQLITELSFRQDSNFVRARPFTATLPAIQINLSTTMAVPGSLSTIFANNVGSDDTVVHAGPLSLSSSATDGSGTPKDFDIVIGLQSPFLYDPGLGNLLLDVRNFEGVVTRPFDADNTLLHLTSRVYSTNVNATSAPPGGSNGGLVTRFTTAIVPEPSAILVLSTAVLVASVRRSGRHRRL